MWQVIISLYHNLDRQGVALDLDQASFKVGHLRPSPPGPKKNPDFDVSWVCRGGPLLGPYPPQDP